MITISNINSPARFTHKEWGSEIMLHNGEYCGKLLRFNAGAKFSTHFHIEKSETWVINKGMIILMWIDTRNADRHTIELKEGDIIDIDKYTPHQVEAITDSEIFEVSSTHHNYDSYRVEKGDNQL